MSEILATEDLGKDYAQPGGGAITILDSVSFTVESGATLSIVGPSGSGKTTLLSLCAGLERPTSGSVRLCGARLETLGEDDLSRLRLARVGFVFQTFRLLPTLTALENVMVPLELQRAANGADGHRSSGDAEARAAELLERVGLGERLDHYPAQLSGGEQQRVAIARAFVHRPEILFADEPTGNLDDETSKGVVDLLFGLNAEHRTTLVLVTHDLELAERTHQVLHLKGGSTMPRPTPS